MPTCCECIPNNFLFANNFLSKLKLKEEYQDESVCVSVCPSQVILRKMLKSSSSNLAQWQPQIWLCIMCYDIALDLHSRSHIIHVTYIILYYKYLIILESFQAMPITFAVKIVRLKVYSIITYKLFLISLKTLTFTQRHNCISKLTNYALICTWIVISRKMFKLWHSNLAWR